VTDINEPNGESGCEKGFCSKLQSVIDTKFDCLNCHLSAARQAERFGGKYIYFCPAGFVHFASPVISNDNLAGAIVAGPVLIIDAEEFFFEDILKKYSISNNHYYDLNKELKSVPYLGPQKVSALSEMLYMVSEYLNGSRKLSETQSILLQQSNISGVIQQIKNRQEQDYYPMEKERELLRKIAAGDSAEAGKILNDLLGHIFFASGQNFDTIKSRVLELLVLLSRGALDGGADTDIIFGMNNRFIKQINKITDIEQLTYQLSQIMTRFTEQVFSFGSVTHSSIISKAAEYIKKNFKYRITLTDVAKYVSLSPAYFSDLFKKETGSNFSEYLNKVRIDNAKLLLENDDLPLIEVSLLCGFEDQSYFTKIFKKLTGTTPKKYKEQKPV
jgi:YesN/AraC family two-component response regulator